MESVQISLCAALSANARKVDVSEFQVKPLGHRPRNPIFYFFFSQIRLLARTFYSRGTYYHKRKSESPVGKSNGLRHSVLKASQNMGCTATKFFYSLWSVKLISISLQRVVSHLVKFNSFMFMHKISSRVICVNRKQPRFLIYLKLNIYCKKNTRKKSNRNFNYCFEIKILLDFS